MPEPNFANRTVWTGDNLAILRGVNLECLDLIYADPPFEPERTLPGSDRVGGGGCGV